MIKQKQIEKWILLILLSIWSGDIMGQWLPGYSHRNKIAIRATNVSGSQDLIDFPLLLHMVGPELRTAAYGGELLNPLGKDLRFTLEDGTLLDFDLEVHFIETGNLAVWIRMPVFSHADNSVIYAYYGNSSVDTYPSFSNVWTADYRGVWHMSFNTNDASQYENHGTDKGTSSMDGKIGLSRGFDGIEDNVAVPYDPSLGIQDALTLETWFRHTDNDDLYNALITKNGDYELWYAKDHIMFTVAGGSIEYPIELVEGQWYHICATYDRSNQRLFVNGTEVSSFANTAQISNDIAEIVGLGFRDGTINSELSGSLDEVRVLSKILDPDWIRTSYRNQNDPAAFSAYIETEIGNDLPCEATLLNINDNCSTSIYSNLGATYSGIPSTPCNTFLNTDTWFKVVVPPSGNINVKLESGPTPEIPAQTAWLMRPGLAIYHGTCDNLTYDTCWVHASAGPPFTIPEMVLTNYTPGDSIFIKIWSSDLSIGKFRICLSGDNELPTITCPNDIESSNGTNQCSATLSIPIPEASSANGIASLLNDFNGTSDATDTYPVGTTLVEWTVTDLVGNTASCSHSITVTDNEAPVISCLSDRPAYVDDNCEYIIPDFTDSVAASDFCDPVPTLSQIPIAGTKISGAGTVQQITLSASDTSNNVSQCQFEITLLDTLSPSASTPAPINVECKGDVPAPDIAVVADEADNCSAVPVVTFVGDVEEGSCPMIITRTYRVSDISGNSTDLSQTITVDDNTNPTFDTNPGNLFALCDLSEQPAYADLAAFITAGGSASDNCGIDTASFSLQSEISSGTGNPLTITRTYLIEDLCGNAGTYDQDIVFTDTQDPLITCSADIQQPVDPGTCNAAVVVSLPMADDNCGIDSVTNDFNGLADASDLYPVGTTAVTWTVTDLNGNSATCIQNIIITDNEAPEIICPETLSETLDENCQFILPDYTSLTSINDNCDPAPTVFQSPPIDTVLSGSGTIQEIVLTARDAAGNESSCRFTITLMDNTPPEAISINDTSVIVQEGLFETSIDLPLPLFADNCGVLSVSNDFNGGTDASGIYQYGTTTVVYTVTDFNGNTATFNQQVIVELENEPDHGLIIPEAFSPNEDGLNDRFEILGLEQYPENELKVYNVHGIEVFTIKNYDNSWDGVASSGLGENSILPTGTYFYILNLISEESFVKGFIYLKQE